MSEGQSGTTGILQGLAQIEASLKTRGDFSV